MVVEIEDAPHTRKKSKTLQQSQNPYWKEEFLLNLSKQERRNNLKCEVFHESMLTSSLDAQMGFVTIPLHEIYDQVRNRNLNMFIFKSNLICFYI